MRIDYIGQMSGPTHKWKIEGSVVCLYGISLRKQSLLAESCVTLWKAIKEVNSLKPVSKDIGILNTFRLINTLPVEGFRNYLKKFAYCNFDSTAKTPLIDSKIHKYKQDKQPRIEK